MDSYSNQAFSRRRGLFAVPTPSVPSEGGPGAARDGCGGDPWRGRTGPDEWKMSPTHVGADAYSARDFTGGNGKGYVERQTAYLRKVVLLSILFLRNHC